MSSEVVPLSRIIVPGLDVSTVSKAGVPTAPALRGEVHEVPDRSEQIDATLLNVRRHPGMR
jgi:hypothetical protein